MKLVFIYNTWNMSKNPIVPCTFEYESIEKFKEDFLTAFLPAFRSLCAIEKICYDYSKLMDNAINTLSQKEANEMVNILDKKRTADIENAEKNLKEFYGKINRFDFINYNFAANNVAGYLKGSGDILDFAQAKYYKNPELINDLTLNDFDFPIMTLDEWFEENKIEKLGKKLC